MRVLDHDQDRMLTAERYNLLDQALDRPLPNLLRRHVQRRIAGSRRHPEQGGDDRHGLCQVFRGQADQGFDLLDLGPGRLVFRDAGRLPDLLDHRIEGAVGVVLGTLIAEAEARIVADLGPELLDQSRLADPRLAEQDHHLALALLAQLPALLQQAELVRAPHQAGQLGPACGLEAGLGAGLADDAPDLDRVVEALELLAAQRLQLEGIPQELPRRRPDHDFEGIGDALQAVGKAGRRADNRFFVGRDLADDRADHHLAGGDADPRPQVIAGLGGDGPDGGKGIARRAHRSLRLVLVGARPAEVGKDPVAQELRHITLVAHHGGGDRHLVVADGRAQLFRVEHAGKRRGIDDVDEHHGQQAPLGRALADDIGLQRRPSAVLHEGVQVADRRQKLAPVAQ